MLSSYQTDRNLLKWSFSLSLSKKNLLEPAQQNPLCVRVQNYSTWPAIRVSSQTRTGGQIMRLHFKISWGILCLRQNFLHRYMRRKVRLYLFYHLINFLQTDFFKFKTSQESFFKININKFTKKNSQLYLLFYHFRVMES